MPRIPVEEFDKEPSIGDKVKVVGRVKEIDEGMVEISYDKVTIMDKKRRKDPDSENDDDDFVEMDESETVVTDYADEPGSLDQALSKAFAKNR